MIIENWARILVLIALATAGCTQRDQQSLDDVRAADVLVISWRVMDRMERGAEMPESLNGALDPGDEPFPVDPKSGAPYEYRKMDSKTFVLCTTFDMASRSNPGETNGVKYGDPLVHGYGNWIHDSGHQCLTRSVPLDLRSAVQ